MFVKIGRNTLPERINQEFYPLSPGQFGRRNEVAVACDKDYSVDLLFQSQRGNVDADAHIHAFLPQFQADVILRDCSPRVGQFGELHGLDGGQDGWRLACLSLSDCGVENVDPFPRLENAFGGLRGFEDPAVLAGDVSEAQRELARLAQFVEQGLAKMELRRAVEFNLAVPDGVVSHAVVGFRIVEEEAVDVIQPVVGRVSCQPLDVILAEAVSGSGNGLGCVAVLRRNDFLETFQEEGTIDEDGDPPYPHGSDGTQCAHIIPPKKISSKISVHAQDNRAGLLSWSGW